MNTWGNLAVYLLWERRCLFASYPLGPYTPQLRYQVLLVSGQEPLGSLGSLTLSLFLADASLVRKSFKFIGDQGFSKCLLLLLRDNPRWLHIYIPFSGRAKRGREVQAALFKNGSRKFHILLSFIFHWQNFVTWLYLVQVRLARTSGYSGRPGAQIFRGRRQDAKGTDNSFPVCKVRQP